ncbi:MAG: Nif3-like dinuclear metal center hexameric protein [Desulfobacterales bacterium]|nr:Nif3-like dinuclear metal center hexameric protein [Desulfobacterales bacterium]
MGVTVADIIKAMEKIAPVLLAEQWDNVGLQIGKDDWPVKRIWVALDPGPEVVHAACSKNVNLLITHHPLIFKPLRSIDFSTPTGAIIQMATRHNLALFSAHTNLDKAKDGLNDVLASKLGLKNLKVLEESTEPNETCQGLGRIGDLDEGIDLFSFAQRVKEKLELVSIKVSGRHDLLIKKVALCTGSGSGLMDDFLSSGAQVYISGDLRYHDARAAEVVDLGLIDIGHFTSEHLIVEVLAGRLQRILSENAIEVKVEAFGLEKDPFMTL